VRVFTEERRCTDNDVNTVHTGLDSELGVIHVASDVGEDPVVNARQERKLISFQVSRTEKQVERGPNALGPLETERADGLAVVERLGRGSGRSQLDVLDTKLVETGRGVG
jgi:hypothetical protein